MDVRRLGSGDEALAQELFATMAAVFEEQGAKLGSDYVRDLLRRESFWILAAVEQGAVLGGLTAHVLPMTRSESKELFIYDVAVRADRQRCGVGRRLMNELFTLAAASRIDLSFVPADDEDGHAIEFYRAVGGAASAVTLFTFEHGDEDGHARASEPLRGH